VGKREAKEVAVSPDGRTLAVAASTGLYFYDTTSLAEVRFIPTDAVIWLWDGQSGKQVRALEGHADWVRGIAFSPESRLLASGSRDGTVRLWGVLR
jgi:WD40 repeat protein